MASLWTLAVFSRMRIPGGIRPLIPRPCGSPRGGATLGSFVHHDLFCGARRFLWSDYLCARFKKNYD